MKEDRRFYVYVFFRPWDASPCYVGKGQGRRWLQHETDANHPNRRLVAIIKKAAPKRLPKVKIRENLTNEEACEIERAFIAAIGRGDHGPLVNLTDGGTGAAGYRRSPELRIRAGKLSGIARIGSKRGPMPESQKRAISLAKIGKPLSAEARRSRIGKTKGIPKSEEWKKKMSIIIKEKCAVRRANPELQAAYVQAVRGAWVKRRVSTV